MSVLLYKTLVNSPEDTGMALVFPALVSGTPLHLINDSPDFQI